jgi:hypothetical protein
MEGKRIRRNCTVLRLTCQGIPVGTRAYQFLRRKYNLRREFHHAGMWFIPPPDSPRNHLVENKASYTAEVEGCCLTDKQWSRHVTSDPLDGVVAPAARRSNLPSSKAARGGKNANNSFVELASYRYLEAEVEAG